MVKVRLAKNSNVPQVGALYIEAGYAGRFDDNDNDTVIVATADEKIIGEVR